MKAEYFIDNDPGIGAATDIAVTASGTISVNDYSFVVSGLADGMHNFYIRFKDANNVWSVTERTPFYKFTLGSATPPPANVVKAEYFIDTDPGIGAAIDYPITSGTSLSDLVLNLNVSAMTEANHTLYVRFKDATGVWSVTEGTVFRVCNGTVPVAASALNITASGFTAKWGSVSGAQSYKLDVSKDNFASFVTGYDSKSIPPSFTSADVTGLSQATIYQYRVRAVNTCESSHSNVISVTVPAVSPTAQPTNFGYLDVDATGASVYYTPPTTAPTGYLVIRRAGGASTFTPSNNVTYNAGQDLGNGTSVAYTGPNILFVESALTPNTTYYYSIYAYNQLNGFTTYLTSSAPLTGSFSTLALEPASQASNLKFETLKSTSFTVSYSGASGSPLASGYLVLRSTLSAPASIPVDGFAYTNTVGTDAIAYQGGALTFNEFGLTENTTYYYAIYSYNGSGTSINYKTLTPLLGNVTTPLTPPATPTSLQFTATTSSISASFTAVGAPSGYLVVRKQGAVASTWPPELNTSYSIGPVSDGTIIYVGPNASFTDIGLTASTQYTYSIFPFRQLGSLISYQTTSLQGSKSTFTAEPTAQTTSLSFSNWTTTSARLTFQPASGSPAGYLVLRKEGSAPALATIPEDGKAYFPNDPLGDAIVVSSSNNTIIDNSGLSPGTEYYFQVYSYNGSGLATNYLTTVAAANSGATITIPDKPIAGAANPVNQTDLTANWTVAKGATKYELDLSSNNFTNITKFSELTGNFKSITGLTPGTIYQYRIRALNASGMSVNSDVISQITVPATPVFASAELIGQTSFKANWGAVTGADEFLLEVSATSNFLSPTQVSPNPSGNTTSATISGLSAGLTYYYRIRSKNAGGNSPYSAAGSQLMLPATPVGVDATNTTSSGFKAKWQAATGASKYLLEVTLATNDFNPSLDNYKKLDVGNVLEWFVTGLASNTAYKYRVWAVNATGETPNASNSISVATLEVGSNGPNTQDIPGFVPGGTLETYRMFSIPWETDVSADVIENNIDVMFEGLGKQADDSWKLLRWNSSNKAFDRYPGQLNKIERGKSYWFNSKTQAKVSVTGTAYSDASFPMVLQPGWNQIGSPYEKNLSWADILATNSTVTNINMVESDLYRYVSSPPGFATTDNLRAWSGNYVFNKSDKQVTLNVRFDTKPASGNRTSARDFERDLSQNNWLVPFTLMVGDREQSNSSIGMHPEAKPGIDEFDGMTVPRFVDYVEMNSPHPEFFEPNFSRDIVATSANHHWYFIAETNIDSEQSLLSWNHVALGTGEAVLILYDPTNGALVNMKEVGQYQFNLKNGKYPLHFIYAKDADNLKPEITSLAQVYPNPAATFVIFPFLTSAEGFVRLEVFDLTGKKVKTLFDRTFPAGLQKVQWDVTDDQGVRVPAGLYIYRFTGSGSQVQTGKLIIK